MDIFNLQRSMFKVRCSMFGIAALLIASAPLARADNASPLRTIVFGSCAHQGRAQDFWAPILASKPDAFIFMGDNIYGDTEDMGRLEEKYGYLAAQPGFKKLRKNAILLATWDDHDFGKNDAGADFPRKAESREVFLDFWEVPKDSPRRQHDGVYDAAVFGPPGKRVQVILLDTRYFRGPLNRLPERPKNDGPYVENDDPSATMLGDEQWAWLDKQLREPAELRLLVSSIQVVANDHHWEKWGNLPRERERLFQLLRDTGAYGIVILSGDRHRGELSRIDDAIAYPLYDVTASALNMSHAIDYVEPNAHRLGELINDDNFGLMTIDWTQPDPEITLQLRDMSDKVRVEQKMRLSELNPGENKE
ncbi:MAG: alkaline phosphatase D family protein [bacterium]